MYIITDSLQKLIYWISPPRSKLALSMAVWTIFLVQTTANQYVNTVDKIRSVNAITPIDLDFLSPDLIYFNPFHLVTMMKQMDGRMILNKYRPT